MCLFKQKTAYEMRISDWSSDVCVSDLVAGAVVAPGVHEVPADGRVVDAIDAAGGLAPGADSARINLAAPVADGERVYVPVVGEEPPPAVVGGPGATGPSGGAAGAGTGPVNLNTADEAALAALPGVGPSTAAAIIAHREDLRSEEHTSELQSLMRISYAVFCLQKKT